MGNLSEVFAKQHDLVAYTDPATGEKKGGFFAQNRRVRAQRFRGERSDGFWVPMSYFAFTGYDLSQLTEGMQFTELERNGDLQQVRDGGDQGRKEWAGQDQEENIMFAEHIETEQLRYFIDQIPLGSLITISEKVPRDLTQAWQRAGRCPTANVEAVSQSHPASRCFRR